MKAKSVLFGLPLLCMACSSPADEEGNATAGAGETYLARQVVGVRALTPDARYHEPTHYLNEEFVRSNFKLEESVELKETGTSEGATYEWGANKVGFSFGNYRPFVSLYAAEHAFNKRYQPELVAEMNTMPKRPYLNGGPASQGLANEWPVLAQEESTAEEEAASTTEEDSTTTVAADSVATVPAVAPAVSAAPVKKDNRFMVIEGVGDKAVWELATQTLHVLYNNHIVNVQVKTNANQAAQQQQATLIANVILAEITE